MTQPQPLSVTGMPGAGTLLRSRALRWTGFIALYLLLDWGSYIEPLYGLNITPWNPPPALGLVYWLAFGAETAVPWFVALVLGEYLIRGAPEGIIVATAFSGWLVLGYGAIGETMRRRFRSSALFRNSRELTTWLEIIALGTLANSAVYLGLLNLAGLIPPGEWTTAMGRFWIGDLVGIAITMPFFWLLAGAEGRAGLRRILVQGETAAYVLLSLVLAWVVFEYYEDSESKHFYLLFVPLIWASTRQGMVGAAFEGFLLQFVSIIYVEWLISSKTAIVDYQVLGAVLAMTTFFVGVVVDEQRRAVEELKETTRLASAAEMAAALAHELNQPMTALSAYARACEELLARGESGATLRDAIAHMLAEATRATDVVRRLRDFLRSGAMRLEEIQLDTLLAEAARPLTQRAAAQGIALRIAAAPDTRLYADALQLQVVLRNLLTNALDSVEATPPGERSVQVTTMRLAGGRICVTIEDSGPGVSVALSDRLFQPFASAKPNGMGLGLVVSRAIVEAHGGELWAEHVGHGLFKLVLPIMEQSRLADA